MKRKFLLGAAIFALTLPLTSCGGDTSSPVLPISPDSINYAAKFADKPVSINLKGIRNANRTDSPLYQMTPLLKQFQTRAIGASDKINFYFLNNPQPIPEANKFFLLDLNQGSGDSSNVNKKIGKIIDTDKELGAISYEYSIGGNPALKTTEMKYSSLSVTTNDNNHKSYVLKKSVISQNPQIESHYYLKYVEDESYLEFSSENSSQGPFGPINSFFLSECKNITIGDKKATAYYQYSPDISNPTFDNPSYYGLSTEEGTKEYVNRNQTSSEMKLYSNKNELASYSNNSLPFSITFNNSSFTNVTRDPISLTKHSPTDYGPIYDYYNVSETRDYKLGTNPLPPMVRLENRLNSTAEVTSYFDLLKTSGLLFTDVVTKENNLYLKDADNYYDNFKSVVTKDALAHPDLTPTALRAELIEESKLKDMAGYLAEMNAITDYVDFNKTYQMTWNSTDYNLSHYSQSILYGEESNVTTLLPYYSPDLLRFALNNDSEAFAKYKDVGTSDFRVTLGLKPLTSSEVTHTFASSKKLFGITSSDIANTNDIYHPTEAQKLGLPIELAPDLKGKLQVLPADDYEFVLLLEKVSSGVGTRILPPLHIASTSSNQIGFLYEDDSSYRSIEENVYPMSSEKIVRVTNYPKTDYQLKVA